MTPSKAIEIPAANICDECKKRPLFGVYGNRKLCIACRTEQLRVDGLSISDEGETVDHTGKAIQRPHVSTPPLKDARSLVATLSIVMEGLLNKSISIELARAACNVSSETVKALDLIWRMDRPSR